jgi:hypothetical protein
MSAMKLLPWISAGLFLLSFAAKASAQPGCAVAPAGVQVILQAPVTGAPFSADLFKESTVILRDGNRIHQESHGKIYRDAEGRARCEIEDAKGSITVIEIVDPPARLSIRLNPQQKTARVTHRPQSPPPPATPLRQDIAAKPPAKRGPSVQHTEEALGNQEIEGFAATGKRYSNTTPAGQAGNEKPITSVMEEWYSNDLKITLLTTRDDPRSGNAVIRVVNIHAGNPDAAVFQIPEGYAVKDVYCRAGLCAYDSE